MSSKRLIRLILDFDGTLTKNDTIAALASVGYESPRNATSAKTWSAIVDAYASDQEQHSSTYRSGKEKRKTIAEELVWLQSLREVERASFERVQSSGMFRNVTKQDLDHAASAMVRNGDVVLRDGWADLIRSFAFRYSKTPPSYPVEVLSVSWSAQWVRGCLKVGAQSAGSDETLNEFLTKRLIIHANEICDFEEPGSDALHSSRDKANVLRQIMRSSSNSQSTETRDIVIYVGDSCTDLECLLAADIGCCIQDGPLKSSQKDLYDTLQRLSIDTGDLSAFGELDLKRVFQNLSTTLDGDMEKISQQEPKVWAIHDLRELVKWLSNWASGLESFTL